VTSSDPSGGASEAQTEPGPKPRYGRITVLGASLLVTATAVLGGLGVLPSGGAPSYAADPGGQTGSDVAAATLSGAEQDAAPKDEGSPEDGTEDRTEEPAAEERAEEPAAEEPDPEELLVPEDSGEGRRVVFDESAQRVWLVKRDGSVERTYLVSGSIYDNLDPGTYQVYSRSERAWGIDDSGTMRYMVRFTTGSEAPIGFHDIPVLDGERVQTRDELGTPLSHGCIRQARPDAKALWEFAPLGTTVVVVD
jgi:hypothetical protein